MGKVDDNKKLKMNTLLQTAFDLFTGKGFAKTTVSDIVNQAGLAKGTFYLYFKDNIIDRFQKQQSLLKFLSKNLSWGVFQDAVGTGSVVSRQFYAHYRNSLVKYNVNCENPDLLLFTLIELISSTSYNCILHEKPVSMEEYKPYLHKSLKKVYEVFVSVQD